MNPATHFDKFLLQHNKFIDSLKNELGVLKGEEEVIRMLRSVFHVLRDRLTIQHSFHLLSNFPAFLKLYYIEGWKYHEKPSKIHTVEEFCSAVEKEYKRFGNQHLPSGKATSEIVNIVLNALRVYIDDSGVLKLLAELPPELQILFENNPVTVYKNEGLNDLG